MGKEGVPIEQFDPKPAIQKNAENARDWEYSEEAKYLYGMAVLFKNRLLDPVLLTDRKRLPDPVISFDDLRNKKTLNAVHYEEEDGSKVWKFGKWAQAETLLHEQVHLWQQNFGKHPVKPEKVTHNKEFVEKCESLGLHPLPVIGAHYAVADGVFAQLMGELGIQRPDDVPRIEGKSLKRDWFRRQPEKGRSTLHPWVCPNCGLKLRATIKGEINSTHDDCGVKYIRAGDLDRTIYKSK